MRQQPLQPVTPSTAKLRVRFLGTKVPYNNAMAIMKDAMAKIDRGYDKGGGPVLFLLEHGDTITTTRSHGQKSLLADPTHIRSAGIEIIETDRGGDVTFHGLGQLVGYLVLRLPFLDGGSHQGVDLLGYVRRLENALLRATRSLGLSAAHTVAGKTGIWISDSPSDIPRKLTAIGVGVSKGVTRHGFALNIATDIEKFTRVIVPCGLSGYGVTSLEREMSVPAIRAICDEVVSQISEAFALQPVYESGFEPSLSRIAHHETRSDRQGTLLL